MYAYVVVISLCLYLLRSVMYEMWNDTDEPVSKWRRG